MHVCGAHTPATPCSTPCIIGTAWVSWRPSPPPSRVRHARCTRCHALQTWEHCPPGMARGPLGPTKHRFCTQHRDGPVCVLTADRRAHPPCCACLTLRKRAFWPEAGAAQRGLGAPGLPPRFDPGQDGPDEPTPLRGRHPWPRRPVLRQSARPQSLPHTPDHVSRELRSGLQKGLRNAPGAGPW